MRPTWLPPVIAGVTLVAALFTAPTAAFSQGKSAGSRAETWRPRTETPAPAAGQIPDSTVLIRVGGDALRVRDFVSRYYNSYPEGRPGTDSLGRLAFLGTLENSMLLRRAALDRNRPLDFGERAIMREHTDRVLSNTLYRRAILDSVQVTESELREMYSMLKTEIRIREITFKQLAPAQRVYDQLRAKSLTWEQAYQRFHQLEKKPDLGDLGWVKRTTGEPTMVERLFRLQAGELAAPWQDINGVHLVQCTETRAASPPPFDVIRARLNEIVRSPRVADRVERISAVLRERIGMTYDTTNIIWAAQRFEDNMSISSSGGAPVLQLSGRLPSFAIADSGRVLARHRDGRLTMFQFIEMYRTLPAIARPAVNTPDRFRAQVDAIALEPYRSAMARERGYDRDPMAVEQIEKRREELLVERLYQDSVEARISVTEADARRYYENNKALYITYPAITYAMWLAKTRGEADSMMTAVHGGLRLDTVIRADSIAKRPARGSVRLMRQNEEGTDFYPELFGGTLKPGEATLVGPDRDGQYAVVQMLEFDPGRQLTLEQAYRLVDEAARHEQAERLLTAFLDRLRKRYRVESHPEWITAFPMTDPSL